MQHAISAERVTGEMKVELNDEREEDKNNSISGTLVVLRLLRSLHGLSDLHPDDVDLCLAVLQHLLSCLEKLLVLQKDRKTQVVRDRVL